MFVTINVKQISHLSGLLLGGGEEGDLPSRPGALTETPLVLSRES